MDNLNLVTVISLINVLFGAMVALWVYFRVTPQVIASGWIMFEDQHPEEGELVTFRLLYYHAKTDTYQFVVDTYEFDPKHWSKGIYIAWRRPTLLERQAYKPTPWG